MFGIQMSEMILILIVILLLFGGKKIPELARGLGKGIAQFKKGVKDIEYDLDDDRPKSQLPTAQAANQQPYKFDPQTGKPVENQP